MKKKTILLFNIFLLLLSAFAMSQDKYFTKSGRISFFFHCTHGKYRSSP